jgi:glycosyltransferase involved in cell wall biosynthesis
LKTALINDVLVNNTDAIKILNSFVKIFPSADVFALLYEEDLLDKLGKKIISSRLQKFPQIFKKNIKYFYRFFPAIIENFDFSKYDLVISLNSFFSHGAVVALNTKHIVYDFSDFNYWRNGGFFLKQWDYLTSKRPDLYIANSKATKDKIKKYYRRDSELLYPPLQIEKFKLQKSHENYFLIITDFEKDNDLELLITLFNKIGRKLIIIGDGKKKEYLQSIAASNIEFLGKKDEFVIIEYLQNCRAYIHSSDTKKISVLEAMACGKPVFGFFNDFLSEIVIQDLTGELYFEKNLLSIEDALSKIFLNEKKYDIKQIRMHAEKFSERNFMEQFKSFLRGKSKNGTNY